MNQPHDDSDRVAHAVIAGTIATLAGIVIAFRTFRTQTRATAPSGSGHDDAGVPDHHSSGVPVNDERTNDAQSAAQDSQRRNTNGRRRPLLAEIKNPAVILNVIAMLVLIVIMAAILIVILIVIGITTPVPGPVVIGVDIAILFVTLLVAWGKPVLTLKRVWHLTVIAGLAGITAIAMWLGFQDVVWAVSIRAQILGAFFILAGISTFFGAFLLAARALPFAPERVRSDVQSTCIAGAAVAGLYVDLTIVAHSLPYEPNKAWLFVILAAGCLVLAIRTLPAAWKKIGSFVKGAGITLALLGAASNFWFQSVYLPENTEVAIQYGLSVDSVVTSGAKRLATLDFTMRNQSSVTALALGSMVIVRGLVFPNNSSAVSNTAAQQNINNYAQDLVTPPPAGAPQPNPNIGSSGNASSMILTVLQPINNDSYLYPNDTITHVFDVVIPAIPKNKIEALQVEIHVLYARSTRLILGTYYGSRVVSGAFCSHDERSAWFINQSALIRFTRGAQVFYSHWCTDLPNPSVDWGVQTAIAPFETPKTQAKIGADIGVRNSSRNEIFVLSRL